MGRHALTSRDDVIRATRGHPYARFATAHAAEVTGQADGHCVIWHNETYFGLLGHALGDPVAIGERLTAEAEVVAGARWVNIPRPDVIQRPDGAVAPGRLPPGYVHRDDWDLRWSVTTPPRQPGEELVIDLTTADHTEINNLLDLAMPETDVRPGGGLARAFYGIRLDGLLVACGADRSSPIEHGPDRTVGVVGAIAVHPAHRRRGLGAAITAGVTRRLARRHALVVLGQAASNEAATRLYPRLGYTGVQHLTSVRRA